MASRKRAKKRSQRRRPAARLVRFEERRRIATRDLGATEIHIGRDPTCDWIVDYANVSRRHLVVRPQGDRNVVQDLGSTNGLRVNGEALGSKPHVLAPGDVIELTSTVVLLYEEGPFASSTPWIVTAVAMILLLIASIGLYLTQSGARWGAPRGARGTDSDPSGTHSRMLPARAPRDAEHRIRTPDLRPHGQAGWRPNVQVQSSGDPRSDAARQGGAVRDGEPL